MTGLPNSTHHIASVVQRAAASYKEVIAKHAEKGRVDAVISEFFTAHALGI
jgi:hypothetical protein